MKLWTVLIQDQDRARLSMVKRAAARMVVNGRDTSGARFARLSRLLAARVFSYPSDAMRSGWSWARSHHFPCLGRRGVAHETQTNLYRTQTNIHGSICFNN